MKHHQLFRTVICLTVCLVGTSRSLSAADTRKTDAGDASAQDGFLPTFESQLKKIRASIDDYSKRIKKSPKDAGLYLSRSQAYASIGEHNLARLDRRKALELDPSRQPEIDQMETATRDVCDTEIVIGTEFLRRGKYAFAEIKFRSAAEADPSKPGGFIGLGMVAYAQKKYDKALPWFNRAIEVKPDFETSYFQRSRTYMKLGQPAKAVEDLNKLIEMSGRPEAFFLRSIAYGMLKQTAEAEADLKKATELDPAVTTKVSPP